jgi:aryl-phospho-beta-D-glucosidase BglC (GH1 family)
MRWTAAISEDTRESMHLRGVSLVHLVSIGFGSISFAIGCGSSIDDDEPAQGTPQGDTGNGTLPRFGDSPVNTPQPAPAPAPVTPPPPPNPAPITPSTPNAGDWQAPASVDPNTPVGLHGQLRVEGTQLVDKNGTAVQLKGISSMWLNWEDQYSTSKTGLQWMRDNWKITIFRAAMGVEPEGAYLSNPEPMLTRLRQVVHNAIDLGVYVLIDWHDHTAHMHPQQAIDFFSKIAAEFGSFPNVLYETYNEPLQDADWSAQIKPYHEAVLPAIRAQDPDGVVILGTRQWSQRVDEAAADPVSGQNLMYTVHFYACDHREQQRGQAQIAYDAGLALFVTEWGATPADGGASAPTVCEDEAQLWHDWMKERNIGWTAWKLDGCADSSCLFNSDQAPRDGGWTDQYLNGHAKFVVQRLLD